MSIQGHIALETPYFIFFGSRLLVALLVGLIMGIERSLNHHYAGIKTMVFVCIGSCLFSAVTFYLKDIYPTSDPTRIIGQIVTGIGFLGAGVIVYSDKKVQGLTSSAVIWTTCGLAIMIGAGLFIIPIAISLFLVIIIFILKWLERTLSKQFKQQSDEDNKPTT